MSYLLCLCLLVFAVPIYAADDSVKLGIALPLTGELASYGEDLKVGTELAIEDINAKNGAGGKKLEAVIEDDSGNPKTAVAVANRFLGEKVAMAFNGVSAASLPVAPIYADENIPFLTLAGTDEVTTHGWKNIIRLIPKNSQEGPRLAELIKSQRGTRKWALLHAVDSYDDDLAKNITAALAADHIAPDADYKLTPQDNDYAALIAKLKDQKIGLVYLGMRVLP